MSREDNMNSVVAKNGGGKEESFEKQFIPNLGNPKNIYMGFYR